MGLGGGAGANVNDGVKLEGGVSAGVAGVGGAGVSASGAVGGASGGGKGGGGTSGGGVPDDVYSEAFRRFKERVKAKGGLFAMNPFIFIGAILLCALVVANKSRGAPRGAGGDIGKQSGLGERMRRRQGNTLLPR